MDGFLGIGDVTSKLQMISQSLGQLVQLVTSQFPRSLGSFTMSATASKTVTDAKCTSSSYVVLIPTNAAAGTLQGSAKCLYVTYASGSFTVSTASAAAAAGTETFQYVLTNPL